MRMVDSCRSSTCVENEESACFSSSLDFRGVFNLIIFLGLISIYVYLVFYSFFRRGGFNKPAPPAHPAHPLPKPPPPPRPPNQALLSPSSPAPPRPRPQTPALPPALPLLRPLPPLLLLAGRLWGGSGGCFGKLGVVSTSISNCVLGGLIGGGWGRRRVRVHI